MGPAHSTIVNHTNERLCVITFNNADIIYASYHTLYVLEPGQTGQVEANPDPTGLKVAIVYAVNPDKNEFLYHRFLCKNDGTLHITDIRGDDISYYGNRDDAILQTKSKIKEREAVPFEMVRSVVYNLPSTPKDVEKASKLPAALQPMSNAAKSFATGIQSGVNQAQSKISNMNDHVVKALGIDASTSSTDNSSTTKPSNSTDSLSSLNHHNAINRPSIPDRKHDVSMADKWEAELRRLKEDTKKNESNVTTPSSRPHPTAPNFAIEKPNFQAMKFEIPDGVLIPQPRNKMAYSDTSSSASVTASSIASTTSASNGQHRYNDMSSHHEDETKSRFRPPPPDPFKPSFLSPAYDEFPPLPVPQARSRARSDSSDYHTTSKSEDTRSNEMKGGSSPTKEDHDDHPQDSHVVPSSHKGCGCVLM